MRPPLRCMKGMGTFSAAGR